MPDVPSDARALSARGGILLFAVLGAAGASVQTWAPDSPAGWMWRVFLASLAVMLVPGAVTVLAWRPRARLSPLEIAAIGFAVSFGILQLLTVAALLFHWPIAVTLALLAAWTVIHGTAALRRGPERAGVLLGWGDALIAMLILGVAVALYVAGSPFANDEDRIHIAILQRLTALQSPAIDNIYVSPGIVYTYPFPGTHYMMAAVATLGGIEPFFLYHKMRGVWGLASLVLAYGCASAAFGSIRIGAAAAILAAAFVVNGTFGAVPGFYWAQMAPFSHASDVAMGIFLPALLLLTFLFLQADARRERWFFFSAAMAMAFMLIVVHVREVVQFLVYLTAFAAVTLVTRRFRPVGVRAAILLAATLVVLVGFNRWHEAAVPTVTTLVEKHRQDLRETLEDSTWLELIGPPLPLLDEYMPAFEPLFYGWNPVILLMGPVVLFLLRRRPLPLLCAASITCYLLIIRVPLLAIPYVYLTYFEILYTPVRNFVYFLHLLAGTGLYLIAAALATRGFATMIGGALAAAGAMVAAFRTIGPYVEQHPDWMFWIAIPAYVLVLLYARFERDIAANEWIDRPRARWIVALALLIVPIFIGTRMTDAELLHVSWADSRQTPELLRSQLPCVDDGRYCPPPPALIDFVQREVPVESIFAIDREEGYPPSLFMPQQMVVWPGESGLLDPEHLFATYFKHVERTRSAYNEQPVFNARETREDRLAFVRDLAVTHIYVTPRFHDLMAKVLGGDPDLYRRRYDDGRWALYEVVASARSR